jgi:hypothetical protein
MTCRQPPKTLLYATTFPGGATNGFELVLTNDQFNYEASRMVLIQTSAIISYALELYYKAVLAKLGLSEQFLSRPELRHNLSALCAEAKRRGFSADNPSIHNLIDYIGEAHSKHHFRYIPESGVFREFDLRMAAVALQRFGMQVGSFIKVLPPVE